MKKWLILRRLTQLVVLGLFLHGPLFGVWIVKGNLASSLTFDILPLTDPYVLLQSLFAGHIPETIALIGALIVVIFYLLIGGRAYCAWVCPVNIVTDAAASLQERFDIKPTTQFSRTTRYWILGMTLVVSWLTATIAWEFINPVSMLFRGIMFGMGFTYAVVASIFLFDLFISHRGWCGHLCPVGAFYSILGKFSLLRVNAHQREQCNDCMDCFKVCPEPQVIKYALKGTASPTILSPNCTNCGQCIDVCNQYVFKFSTRVNS